MTRLMVAIDAGGVEEECSLNMFQKMHRTKNGRACDLRRYAPT